jgi:hypothetical protein
MANPNQKMKIAVFMPCWNEEYFLRNVINHYAQFGIDVYIVDNGSTDNSQEIVRSMSMISGAGAGDSIGGRINLITSPAQELDDRFHLKVKGEISLQIGKKIGYDWILCVDVDELLSTHFLQDLAKGEIKPEINAIQPFGYSCYSYEGYNGLNLFSLQKQSIKDEMFSKVVAFRPSQIARINYTFGCHNCQIIPERGYKANILRSYALTHLKFCAGWERITERNKIYAARLSKFNTDRKLGSHYLLDENIVKTHFEQCVVMANSWD